MRRLLLVSLCVISTLFIDVPDAHAAAGSVDVCNAIRRNESGRGSTVTTFIDYGWFDYNGSMPKECGARAMKTFIHDVTYIAGYFDIKWGNATVHKASTGAGVIQTGFMSPGWLTNYDVAVPYSIKWRHYCIACPSYSRGTYVWATAVQWKREIKVNKPLLAVETGVPVPEITLPEVPGVRLPEDDVQLPVVPLPTP